jgi:hypothetical protein
MSTETNLEEEFQAVTEEFKAKIKSRLELAREALEEAEQISEKYGIPFSFNLRNGEYYAPKTYGKFQEKFRPLVGENDDEEDGEAWFNLLDKANLEAPRQNYSYFEVYDGWSNSTYSC